jgi:hypothetical protein
MMILALILTLAAAITSAEPATVTADAANLRSGAGTQHPVVGALKRGTRVEILETSGPWHRVRAAEGGLEGWVSARLLERSAPGAAPPTAASRPQPAAPTGGGVTIDHRAVSCLVAEEFAKIEACVTPADSVARTQVHFRASDASPWYSVDMRADGSCLSAVLPKPKKTTTQVQYFIYSLDRQFAEVSRPEGAPGASFDPKVVAAKGQCGRDSLVSTLSGGVREIVVNVARSPGGKLIEGAASALGSPAEMAGFSAEGVIPGQATSASSGGSGSGAAAAGAAAGAGGAAAGGGVPIVLVAGGGALAAGAGLVVVTSGGGNGEEESSSLTGTWAGTVAANKGLTMTVTVPGASCVIRQDIEVALTQNGNTVTGPGTGTTRSFTCSFPEIQPIVQSIVGQGGSGQLVATLAPPNAISFDFGEGVILRGTYTSTTMDATGRLSDPEGTVDYVLSMVKR